MTCSRLGVDIDKLIKERLEAVEVEIDTLSVFKPVPAAMLLSFINAFLNQFLLRCFSPSLMYFVFVH